MDISYGMFSLERNNKKNQQQKLNKLKHKVYNKSGWKKVL